MQDYKILAAVNLTTQLAIPKERRKPYYQGSEPRALTRHTQHVFKKDSRNVIKKLEFPIQIQYTFLISSKHEYCREI